MGFSSKRRLVSCKRFHSPYVASSPTLLFSEFRESSPVDSFLIQKTENGGVSSVRFTSDIYMLFNQKRLDKMSSDSLSRYFESLSVQEPRFSELRGKLGDSQLISFVKSRYIQSPSELMAWSQYLMSSSDEVVASLAAAQTAATPAPSEPEPAPTD